MENDGSWEQNALRNELIQGMEVARKLQADLKSASFADNRDLQVQRLISSYDRALLILSCNASISKSQTTHHATITSSSESPIPISVSISPPRENNDGLLMDHQELKHCSKKRKETPKWVDQVKVNSDNGIEGTQDDGYSWRKYGQKDILGAKYPRSYYRCTFRNSKGCCATKQVQRSDEDPTIFDITYRGSHTCSKGNNALLPPKSPDVQEKPHSYSSDIYHSPPSYESLANFRKMLTVPTDNMGNPFTSPTNSFGCTTQENHSLIPLVPENNSFFCNLSQTNLLSPNTPESTYFPSPAFQMNEFDGIYSKPCSESDVTEIISTNTSTTNSPIFNFDFDFPREPVEIDPNFAFNSYEIFP